MLKKISVILILVLILLAFSNFTEANNIENYYYVVAIGIDQGKDDNISLSVQIAADESNSSSDSSQSSSSQIYTVEAISIPSGISIFDNYLSKKLSFSHCSAIVFSEDIAKKGINPYITTLSNNSEIRPNCKIIVSNLEAKTALEAISNSDEDFSSKLYEFAINSANYTGYSINPKITDFLYLENSNFPSAVSTYAIISDDGILQNVGIGIFEGDKFKTNLTALDAIFYSIITNNVKQCLITIPDPFFDGKYLDILISPKKNCKIKVNLVNGSPYIEINAYLEGSINSMNSYFNYESKENIKIIENSIDSYLEKNMLNFLYKISHEYNLDICKFENYSLKNFLTFDDFEKANWKEVYKDSCFKVNIESSIDYSGLLSSE